METIILLVFFAPLLFLILFLVRHARRIHREVIDKTVRTERLDDLDRSLVRTVLERDQHTCQSCGATTMVGVDFRDDTPGENQPIRPDDLEARCTSCYLARWDSFQGDSPAPED